ncbi:NADH-quinone oxidoreductase subunit NuoN [Acidianus sp. HS-5]|uniref:NADH-quinone oxidoreductase subunit NuoN n=1 Tax=Acidianus sp. HS-5 TaxID=2886040 RepID=UPI001F1F7649|nr:NADH-quinone oxidoreductase subunit NuoN [Acidianus sp. HS-5]BDC19696.1 NADH-quinone oxidoreductase subunit N [Acidianus sp. HS-5]
MLINDLPIIIVSALFLFSSISVLFIKEYSKAFYLSLSANVIGIIVLAAFWVKGFVGYTIFSCTLYIDNIGYLFSMIVLIGTIVVIIGGKSHVENWTTRSSMLSLLLLTGLGLIYMAFAYNILIILGAWGISSAASYAITMLRKDYKSVDAGIKYLVMGLISSSFMILGFALYFLSVNTFSLNYETIEYPYLFMLGLAMLSVAFFFKLGAFPFQGWLPDVYINADRISVSFISSVGKLLGIVPLLRIISLGDPTQNILNFFVVLFSIMSVLSMIVGNIIAFSRKDLPSILAFSSITQMGFILIGFVALKINVQIAEAGLVTQSLAYVIAQAGLFNFVNYIEKVSGTARFEGLRGLAKYDKGLATSASILVLSLLGIPPILGFWGKLFLFESVYLYPWLIIIAVLSSAISAGYYIPIIREMFREGEMNFIETEERDSVIFSAILSIGIGIISPLILVVV